MCNVLKAARETVKQPGFCLRLVRVEAGPEQRDLRQPERHAERAAVPPHHAGGGDGAVAGVRPRCRGDPRPGLQL